MAGARKADCIRVVVIAVYLWGHFSSIESKLSPSINVTKPPMITSTSQPTLQIMYQQGNLPSTAPPNPQIGLRACCDTNCVSYDNLQSMVGLQCCATTPVNFFDNICCNGVAFQRNNGRKYYDRCCEGQPYSYDQTCCQGKIFEGTNLHCCGDVAYNVYDRTKLCCIDILHSISFSLSTSSTACCGNQVYDKSGAQFCCGGKVYNTTTTDSCCVSYKANPTDQTVAEGFKTSTQLCCDKVYLRSALDACCYVADTTSTDFVPPRPVAYNSTTHCCDFTGVKKLNKGVCPV